MLLTLGLAIAGQIVYQVGQRAVPAHAPPVIVLILAYAVAGLICVALAWPFGAFSSEVQWRLGCTSRHGTDAPFGTNAVGTTRTGTNAPALPGFLDLRGGSGPKAPLRTERLLSS
jgi:hypothetical protein